MRNYRKASVISLILIIIYIRAESQSVPEFKSCEQAFLEAKRHVMKDSVCWFESVHPNTHDSDYTLNPDKYFLKRKQFDSLMFEIFGIRVIRTNYSHNIGLQSDAVKNCYNKAIEHHMDSTYVLFFHIRVLNMVEELNGEPPLVTDEELEEIIRSKKKGN